MSVVVAADPIVTTMQNLTQENESLRQENEFLRQENLRLKMECDKVEKIAQESFEENQRNLTRLDAIEKAFGEFQQTSLRRVAALEANLDKSNRFPFWKIGCVMIIGGGVYLVQNFGSLREKVAKYF